MTPEPARRPRGPLSILRTAVQRLVRPTARRRPMLAVGTAAPDFALPAHSGRTVRLAEQRGQRVVLWFYPKADTPG